MNISERKYIIGFYPNVVRIQHKLLSAQASPGPPFGVDMVHLRTLILEDVVGEKKRGENKDKK